MLFFYIYIYFKVLSDKVANFVVDGWVIRSIVAKLSCRGGWMGEMSSGCHMSDVNDVRRLGRADAYDNVPDNLSIYSKAIICLIRFRRRRSNPLAFHFDLNRRRRHIAHGDLRGSICVHFSISE